MIEAKGLEIRVTGDGAEILGELFGVIVSARMELYAKADPALMDALMENVLTDAMAADVAVDIVPAEEQKPEPEKPKKRRGRPKKVEVRDEAD